MKAFVTGASGFLGGNLCRVLLSEGREVRVLLRKTSDRRGIEGLPLEIVEGDVADAESCEKAAKGCGEAYHCAAAYQLFVRDKKKMYEANVQGTANVLKAAAKAGASRIVYTSTVGALGNKGDGTPGTEETPVSESDMVGPYKHSKFLAEQEALKLFREEKIPVVIVNPTAPIGPWDVKPTPTGRVVLDFLKGDMPAYVDTGLNVIDVEDCARGHLLAALKGRPGEKYILGGENLTLEAILKLLAEITGKPAPRWKLPYLPVLGMAYVAEGFARLTGWPEDLRLNVASVKMAKKKMWFSSEKARKELGLSARPAREALERAAKWFEEHGYTHRPS